MFITLYRLHIALKQSTLYIAIGFQYISQEHKAI